MSSATDVARGLRLADAREAAGLAAFLARLLRYDRAAVVRLQTAGQALAVFGRMPLGDPAPLAVRPARLAAPEPLDVTLAAGQLLDALEALRQAGDGDRGGDPAVAAELSLPPGVTGPAWAGLLPPRSGWQPVAELRAAGVVAAVSAAVAEFRARAGGGSDTADAGGASGVPVAAVAGEGADAVADRLWSRPLEPVGGLPLRAAHAAQVLGFLVGAERLTVHRHQAWLRLTTPGGSIAVRRAARPGAGLGLTPVR
jgi:hypothetical protein